MRLPKLLFVFLLAPALSGGGQVPASNDEKLELRLSAPQATYRVGEPVHLRLELHNTGDRYVFVGITMAPILNAPSYVVLEFQDKKGNSHPDEGLRGELSRDSINQWWVRVAPGHYYGVQIELNGISHPFLSRPGTYRIRAKYISRGGRTPRNTEWNIPWYEVWAGELESNAIWINIEKRPGGPGERE